MNKCENCLIDHDGTYGSGRFCSMKCSKGFSTKAKRKEINEKVRIKLTKVLTDEELEIFKELKEQKKVQKEIANQLNISVKKVKKIVKINKLNIDKPKLTKEERKQQISKAVVKYRQNQKLIAIEYKGGSCNNCGYNKSVRALVFHHRNPEEKSFGIGGNGETRKFETVKKELDKCDLLCVNCHSELHDKENYKSINHTSQKSVKFIQLIKDTYNDIKTIKGTARALNTTFDTVNKYIFNKIKIQKSETKQKLVDYKGGCCSICKYKESLNSLHFHHLDPNEKDLNISKSNKSFDNLKYEVDKCILVCGNCHAEIHDNN